MGTEEPNEWHPQLPNCAGHAKKALISSWLTALFVKQADRSQFSPLASKSCAMGTHLIFTSSVNPSLLLERLRWILVTSLPTAQP